MLWRATTSPWRSQTRLPSAVRSLERNARNSSNVTARKTPSKARRAPDANKGPPHVKHARLLGDGKPYHTDQLAREIKVTGLIRSIRKQKHVAFAHVNDGTTYAPIQAIITPELAKDITNGAYVELLGNWQESPAEGQTHELQVKSVLSIGESDPEENPIQKKETSRDFLLSIPHMRLRTPLYALLARTRSHLIRSASDYFELGRRQAVVQVHPPLITSTDCEGAGEVFTVSPRTFSSVPGKSQQAIEREQKMFFREPKYLTVSSQLHLEAWAAELGDVWTLSPTFRAEESDTSRHLAEFYMLEAEFRGPTKLEAITGRVEQLIKWLAKDLRQNRKGQELLDFHADRKHRTADIKPPNLEERWSKLEGEFRHVTYKDAIKQLKEAHDSKIGELFQTAPTWDRGLQIEHERWVVENLGGGGPTFVTHYPRKVKPFYMLPSNTVDQSKSDETVACFDLLLPYGYGEIAGGSLREHRLEPLIQSMRSKGLLKNSFEPVESQYPFLRQDESLGSLQWYTDLRRYGSSPHGGFGLGFDRLLAYMTGISNIRDVVGFPRAWGRADC